MTGCCVPQCFNSSQKGFIMKRFPKNPTRKALWATCVSRLNWTPSDNAYICEIHFPDNMWETTRVDGKRKLKSNAIPTLFQNYLVKTESLVEEKDPNYNRDEYKAINIVEDLNENEHEVMNVTDLNKNEKRNAFFC
ncbi:THAP domain-containing protein 4 [Camponotus japonicus]